MTRTRPIGVMALAVALLAVPAAASDGSLAPLFRELDGMRGQLRNAGVKLENGVVAPRGDAVAQDDLRPARLCCGHNLVRLQAKIAGLHEALDGLATVYQRDGNREGTSTVIRVRDGVVQMVAALEAFDKAETKAKAEGVLRGMGQIYVELRDNADALVRCCAPLSEAPAQRDRQKPSDKAP